MKNMREIKFRAWDNGVMWYPVETYGDIYNEFIITLIGEVYRTKEESNGNYCPSSLSANRNSNIVLMQFTGLLDKNGKEVYEGDVVRWRNPYRTTQTHTGDNIPNGSYTEPMEPGIKTHEGDVQFKDGGFVVMNDDHDRFGEGVPIQWCGQDWTLEDIREAISYGRPDRFMWDDPEEGDLPYLINEVAKVKDENELVEYLKGIEVISNIYETPELITTPTGA